MTHHEDSEETLNIPDPRQFGDENAAERWAEQRIAREDGARTNDRRREHLMKLMAARGVVQEFMANLSTGADPWEREPLGRVIVSRHDDEVVASLVAHGLKRRRFEGVTLKDEHEGYGILARAVPPGLARWSVMVADPILSLKP